MSIRPASAETSAPAQHSRVALLDLLRLLAALTVVAYHYAFRGHAADDMTWLSLDALQPVAKYGYLGVQLFFVISGFVIAYSAEGRNARQFFVARASRIYPGFLACMTITFLVTVAIGAPRYEATAEQWVVNLVIVAPALGQPFMDGVYWSIVTELIFYFWAFLLIIVGFFPRRVGWIVAGWLILSVVNETIVGSGIVHQVLLTGDSGFFAAGLMLYAIHSGRGGRWSWALLWMATGVAAQQAMVGSDWVRQHFDITLSNTVIGLVSLAAIGLVGAGLMIRRVLLPAGLVLALGGLTYPLYLLHQQIGFIVFNRLQGVAPAPALAAAMVAALLLLSFIIWRFVERPGQRAMKTALSAILRVRRPAAIVVSETAAELTIPPVVMAPEAPLAPADPLPPEPVMAAAVPVARVAKVPAPTIVRAAETTLAAPVARVAEVEPPAPLAAAPPAPVPPPLARPAPALATPIRPPTAEPPPAAAAPVDRFAARFAAIVGPVALPRAVVATRTK